MAIDQNARLGLPADQNPPLWPWEKASCTRKPYTTTDFPLGSGQPGWASTYQVITRLNPSAAQREAGQHDEHDDREPAVDHPGRPERSVIGGVARPGTVEDVVEHDEQGGQAPDPVQADDAARPGGRDRRGWRGWRVGRRWMLADVCHRPSVPGCAGPSGPVCRCGPAARQVECLVSGVPRPVTGYGRSITNG